MKWYIGQPIVAIRNHSRGDFKKGDEFTIVSLMQAECRCKNVLIDIGIRCDYLGIVDCEDCGGVSEKGTNINWYDEVCFAPLDTDISELIEILKAGAPHEQI